MNVCTLPGVLTHAAWGLIVLVWGGFALWVGLWRLQRGKPRISVAPVESTSIIFDRNRLRYRTVPSYADFKGGDTPFVAPKPKQLTPEETERFSDELAARNPELVSKLQEAAQRLAREKGKISSDDVWEVCPIPAGVEPRIMARAFMPKKLWRKVGHAQTRRRERQGGTVTVWELREREAA